MVVAITDVTIEEVRQILSNVGIKTIQDGTVYLHIDTCVTYINSHMISGATDANVKIAAKYWASYLSAISYVTLVSRELGRLPVGIDVAIDNLKDIAFGFLRAVLPSDDDIFGEVKEEDKVIISHGVMSRSYEGMDTGSDS